jgi:hypothetical protein
LQYTQEQLINIGKFISDGIIQIGNCRQEHNRLGFGYQLALFRLLNRFPTQVPFEVLKDIVQDDPKQAKAAAKFIEQSCSKDNPGYINHLVLCEIV